MSKINFKFFIILLVVLLFVQTISAEDWFKFDNIKQYNETTKTVTVVDVFGIGKTIADIQLTTPSNVELPLGYFNFANITLTSYGDYTDVFSLMEFYDKNINPNVFDDKNQINRKFDVLVRDVEGYSVNDYKLVPNLNGTGDMWIVSGNHTEYRTIWKPLDNPNISLKELEPLNVELWTTVENGDNVEWIPTFMGKIRVTEWGSYNATGGTLTTDGIYEIHTFTTNGTFTVTGSGTIEILMIGGGGAGGGGTENMGAGGGAGGWLNATAYSVTAGDYPVIVGAGGTGVSNNAGGNGQNTTFDTLIAWGGGGGGAGAGGGSVNGVNGGSGGGAGRGGTHGNPNQTNNGDATGFGNEGGNSSGNGLAGGGGAGVAGQSSTASTQGGNGGDGLTSTIYNGTALWYAGGGGGGGNTGTGTGGKGGGGHGGAYDDNAGGTAGTDGTGGGGGGCGAGAGGCAGMSGGSGIVIIRMLPIATPIPDVTLTAPANYSNLTNPSVYFEAEVTDDEYVENVSLYLDGTLVETNTSHVNGTYGFTKLTTEGEHDWNITAFNNNSKSNDANTGKFWVNTTPYIELTAPEEDANLTYHNVFFNATLVQAYDIANWSLYINDTLNYTNTDGVDGAVYKAVGLGDGYYNWSMETFSSLGAINHTITRNLTIDGTIPTITISYPANTTYTTNITSVDSIFIDFNWTTTDEHRDKCWYSNDSGVTNTTISCDNNVSYYDAYGQKTFFAGANDTLDNNASATVTATWNYKIFENSRSVPTTATEGSTQTFTLNLSNPSYPLTSAYLNFNGTRYTANINTGTYTILTSTFVLPAVTSDDNDTILWELFIADGGINTTASYMNLTDLSIDNCSTNTIVLYNFTIFDEINQDKLNETKDNTSGKINLQIYPFGNSTLFLNYSYFFNMSNPFYVCLNDSLGDDNFTIDAEVEYDAYVNTKEYYHFQNDTLNTTYLYKNISLYDLNDSYAYTFKITYKDDSGIPVDNALIEVWRKYVDEDLFKISEIAKTDSDGVTQAKLQLNDVIYNFVVKKNGVTFDSFNNKFVRCDNYIYNICEIKLNSFSSYPTTEDYTEGDDFDFTLTYNRTTRIITSVFNIPSGTSSTVVLNATLLDNLGTTLACTDSEVSSSGTLTCLVPNAIGNGSVNAQLFKNNVYQAGGTIKLERTPSSIYGSSLVFLLLFLYLTLIGMAIGDNPMIAGLFLILGAILGILLNFVASSGFVGAGATILWFIIAVIIMLIKGGKRT